MENELVYWEFTAQQKADLEAYCSRNNISLDLLPGFLGPYNGYYYVQQNPNNPGEFDWLFQDFDMDDGIIGDSYGTHTWTLSTVPNVLWP